jgi:hypothetical protein
MSRVGSIGGLDRSYRTRDRVSCSILTCFQCLPFFCLTSSSLPQVMVPLSIALQMAASSTASGQQQQQAAADAKQKLQMAADSKAVEPEPIAVLQAEQITLPQA